MDFVDIKKKINIEIDGLYHRKPQQMENNRKRDEHLTSIGWKVVRIRVRKSTEPFINTLNIKLSELGYTGQIDLDTFNKQLKDNS